MSIFKGGINIIIYIDVLIITSVYIDYLLIRATAAVLRIPPPSSLRTVIGALTGSLFSLLLLTPHMNGVFLSAVKVFSAACVIFVSFGFGGGKDFAKETAVFIAVSLVFAGVCFFLSETAAEKLIYCKNGAVYFNISAEVLIISTAAAYGGIYLFRRLSDSSPKGKFTVTVRTENNGLVSFSAIADTGNRLTDIITGIPVIVCGREHLADIITDIPDERDMPKKGWRLIPFETAAGAGLIPIFRPREIYIRSDETRRAVIAEAYIGVSSFPMKDAVFNPNVLRY